MLRAMQKDRHLSMQNNLTPVLFSFLVLDVDDVAQQPPQDEAAAHLHQVEGRAFHSALRSFSAINLVTVL